MKLFRKILIGFLGLILTSLIVILTLSYNIQTLLIDGIVKETIIQRIMPKNYNTPNISIPDDVIKGITSDEQIQEILKKSEIQDLIQKYLNKTIDSLTEDGDFDENELKEDVLGFLNDNKKDLENIIGSEITEEYIDEAINKFSSSDFAEVFERSIEQAKSSLTTKEVVALKWFKHLISKTFRLILLGLIVLDLLLIAILQSSWVKWIKTLGEAFISSGISLIIIGFIVKYIVYLASSFKFNISSLIYASVGLIITGLLIVIIYKIFEVKYKNKKKEELQNE